ncbi:MAG: hypothetical protein WKH64_15360 [Chloroflexia bacterium]
MLSFPNRWRPMQLSASTPPSITISILPLLSRYLELAERLRAANGGDLGALRATLREKAAVLGLTLEPAQPPPAS